MNKKLQNLLEEQLTKNLHMSQVGGAWGGRGQRWGGRGFCLAVPSGRGLAGGRGLRGVVSLQVGSGCWLGT